MKNKIVDIVCLCAVGAVFGGLALWNAVQPNRPTESMSEKRKLAEMPRFTVTSLADGSYFSGISAFVSDTFVERERLVGLSKKMDTLRGFDYSVGGDESFVLLNPSQEKQNNEPEDQGTADAISSIFDALLNPTGGENTDVPTETSAPESDPNAGGEPDPAETEAPPAVTDETEPAEEPPAAETEPPVKPDEPEATEPGETEADTPDPKTTEEPEPAGTETEETEAPEPEEPEPEPELEPEPDHYAKSLSLSKDALNLTVGTGTVLYAYAETTDPAGAMVHWTNSDKSVATISINPQGGIDVKAVGPGKAVLTCTLEDFKKTCTVTVSELTVGVDFTPPTDDENANADFLPDGLFIYGDGVYTQTGYNATNSAYFAQTAAVYAQKFGCRVSVVIAPVSSMVIDNPNVKSKISDQGKILSDMKALFDPSVNFVDTYTPLYEHRDEYLFFRTDHHWTQRGAYYAYAAFAESVGFTPTPLSFFDFEVRNDNYSGSMYDWTLNPRVLEFSDQIEAFYPTKKHTMTVTLKNGGTNVYDSSIVKVNKTYVTFIAGDNPYTVINVPDNPQDRNILVMKDSFGNAFVPFLCEHYGNIIVVDTRHTGMNVYEQLKDYGLTDIVFVNNIQAANTYAWAKRYMAAVGVYLP